MAGTSKSAPSLALLGAPSSSYSLHSASESELAHTRSPSSLKSDRKMQVPAKAHQPPRAPDGTIMTMTIPPRARTSSTTTTEWSVIGHGAHDLPSLPRRHRASLLGAVSDRFGRRKKPSPPTTTPTQTYAPPLAIEVDLAEEAEERHRLRDAAAQSVGLELEQPGGGLGAREKSGDPDEEESSEGASGRISVPSSYRNATPSPTVPAFPATQASLAPFVVLRATLPKHYPPPSLLLLALSKQWKSRTVVLTGPVSARQTGASHLHLFRGGAGEERELERLEINERSVVFVANEEVGGRRQIVKVGGLDVGTGKKDGNSDESGLSMMLLQIVNPSTSHTWISQIKSAVLRQRSIRAGLGHYATGSSASEPRGDLDVVLSMRMQGMSGALPPPSDSSSQSSTRPNSPRPALFKGLFGNTRPRSVSRATSVASSDEMESQSPHAESFASVASSMMASTSSDIPQPYSRRIVQNRTSIDAPPFPGVGPLPPPPRITSPIPNRRRAYTTNDGLSPRLSIEPPERDGRIYTFGNASTSFGSDHAFTPTAENDSPAPTPAVAALATPEVQGKSRANSVSSLSTLGADKLDRSRWSRQSALATLSAKSASRPSPHPYAAVDAPAMQRPPSRTSTSTTSHRTLGLLSIKRASVSSAVSASASSMAESPAGTGNGLLSNIVMTRKNIAARQSMPPPQRPAPISALPPTPDASGAPPTRPRSMSARRPGTAPSTVPDGSGLIGGNGFSPPGALSAGAGKQGTSRMRLSLQPHRRTTSSGADVTCAPPRPPPSGPLPPPPSEGHRGGLTLASPSTSYEQKRSSFTLDPRRGSGSSFQVLSQLQPLPAPPESPTIAAAFVQRLRMLSSPTPPRIPTPTATPPLSPRELGMNPGEFSLSLNTRENGLDVGEENGGPILGPSLARELAVADLTESSFASSSSSAARILDLRTEGSSDSRPASPSVGLRIADPSVLQDVEAEEELQSGGPIMLTGVPTRPPRSARRPPPRTTSGGGGSDTGIVTALAPPPRRRLMPALQAEDDKDVNTADDGQMGRRLQLPDDLRADLGRAGMSFSRLSLALGEGAPAESATSTPP